MVRPIGPDGSPEKRFCICIPKTAKIAFPHSYVSVSRYVCIFSKKLLGKIAVLIFLREVVVVFFLYCFDLPSSLSQRS